MPSTEAYHQGTSILVGSIVTVLSEHRDTACGGA